MGCVDVGLLNGLIQHVVDVFACSYSTCIHIEERFLLIYCRGIQFPEKEKQSFNNLLEKLLTICKFSSAYQVTLYSV